MPIKWFSGRSLFFSAEIGVVLTSPLAFRNASLLELKKHVQFVKRSWVFTRCLLTRAVDDFVTSHTHTFSHMCERSIARTLAASPVIDSFTVIFVVGTQACSFLTTQAVDGDACAELWEQALPWGVQSMQVYPNDPVLRFWWCALLIALDAACRSQGLQAPQDASIGFVSCRPYLCSPKGCWRQSRA